MVRSHRLSWFPMLLAVSAAPPWVAVSRAAGRTVGDAEVVLLHASQELTPADTEERAVCILNVAVGGGGCTTRASVATDGTQTDAASTMPALSGDGRFVAFQSFATQLVPMDTNFSPDIFVRDLQTLATERASVASDGTQAGVGGLSLTPSASGDGRFVAFGSFAQNLTPGNPNEFLEDIFVRDRQTGATELISVATGGGPGNGQSQKPSISADGRYVAFESNAKDLVAQASANPQAAEVYVRDRQMGATERVSVSSEEAPGGSDSTSPSISADGRFVAFFSNAGNLIDDDANGIVGDVYVRDLEMGTTELISLDKDGVQSTVNSYNPSISGDGRYVAFSSFDPNLVEGDGNQAEDIFVRDRQMGTNERVSVSSDGTEADLGSLYPAISADGRFVAFISLATNLVGHTQVPRTDIYLRDRELGVTERINLSTDGVPGEAIAVVPSIGADGRFVAFVSGSRFLVPGDTNTETDIFVRDRAP